MEVSQTTKEMLHDAIDFAKTAPISFIFGGILSQLSAGLVNAALFFPVYLWTALAVSQDGPKR